MITKFTVALLFSVLLPIASFAQDFYVSLEGASTIETFKDRATSTEWDDNATDYTFKVGIGEDGDMKYYLYYSQISYESNSSDVSQVGIEFLKEYKISQISNEFLPFVKFGLGYGTTDNDFKELSAHLGIGLSVKIFDNVYIVGGSDFIKRYWEYKSSNKANYSSRLRKQYIGLTFRF